VLKNVLAIRKTLLDRARAEAETVMPGYTHLLHAQPTTLAHYLLAIHDHLLRDTKRLLRAYETVDQCTLGCGAMSGTSLPVDRERVRELLGFARLCENTIDSVSASDQVTETASALASVMMIIGRLAQDLYVFSSQEFNLIDITDAFASPSSLMPQKKNALVLEYVRSRTAQTIGHLTGSFTVIHNVGYMDTEEVELETYQPLMDAFTLTEQALQTMNAFVGAMQPNRDVMRRRANEGFSAVTALAEAIQVHRDLSYRTAHRVVARAVLLAVEQNKDATGIDSALVDQAAKEMIGRELKLDAQIIQKALDPKNFVEQHAVIGGPAPKEVRRMINERLGQLETDGKATEGLKQQIDRGKQLLKQATDRIVSQNKRS
jgi:argininosuccinate lyase